MSLGDDTWLTALRDAVVGSGMAFARCGDGDTIEATGEAGPVARMSISAGTGSLRVVLTTGGPQVCGSDDAARLVRALPVLGRLAGCITVDLVTTSLLVRYQAREAGFEGGLRQPLRRLTTDDRGPAGPLHLDPALSLAGLDRDDPSARSREAEIRRRYADRHGAVATALNALVPRVRFEPAAPPGAARRLVHRSTTGFAARLGFMVSPDRVPLEFRLTFPDTPDLMVEPVAAVLDTTVAVAAAVGGHLRGLREIAMRHDIGMRQGRVAGLAQSPAGQITLNGSYTSASHYSELLFRRRATPPKRPPAPAPPPFLDVDRVVAHELWHLLEAGWMATDYAASMELLRSMGEYYGVETLQRITRPDLDGAGAPLEPPYRQLINDVSAYATSNVREATAEFFAKWWCSPQPQPPAIRHFGQQLHALLGIARP